MKMYSCEELERMEQEALDPVAFPFEEIWETQDLFIEPFEIDDNFWEEKQVTTKKRKFDMNELYGRMNEMERQYKAIRLILSDDDLCEFMKDTCGFDKNDFSHVSIDTISNSRSTTNSPTIAEHSIDITESNNTV
jgi:hypothetical protein